MKRSMGENIFSGINVIFLVLLGFTTLYPFLYTLTVSLSPPELSAQFGLHIFPKEISLGSYAAVVHNPQVYTAYKNTVIRTTVGTFIIIFFTILVAYPLSRITFPFRKIFMFLLIFSLIFTGGIIPKYLLVKRLGLLNRLWALIIPDAVRAYYVIIMINFFKSIPDELIDSARIDGASEMRVLLQIVVPLSGPVIAVLSLWGAVEHWNSWFDAIIYITDPGKEVLQSFLRRTVLEESNYLLKEMDRRSILTTPESLKSALLMFVSLPILIVYPFIQRYFVKGVMLGSLKG